MIRKGGSNWVDGENSFDRKAEPEALEERVRVGTHTLLTAQRRMGKTVIVREMQRRLAKTAKGQITLPKAVRQALGVDFGAKVAFELRKDGQIVVSLADTEHEDPAIAAFLDLLAGDIQAGRQVRAMPDDLAKDMPEHAGREAGPEEDIDSDVDL